MTLDVTSGFPILRSQRLTCMTMDYWVIFHWRSLIEKKNFHSFYQTSINGLIERYFWDLNHDDLSVIFILIRLLQYLFQFSILFLAYLQVIFLSYVNIRSRYYRKWWSLFSVCIAVKPNRILFHDVSYGLNPTLANAKFSCQWNKPYYSWFHSSFKVFKNIT